jgi:hypothetical protein
MLAVQTGLTDIARLRFAADSQFLLVGDGRTLHHEDGYEVWHVPPQSRPAHPDSGIGVRDMEWHSRKPELYVPCDPTLDIVAPTGKRVQLLRDAGWVEGLHFSPAGD